MNSIQLIGLIILTLFYASFFIKMILMKRQGINSNLLGKGDKPAGARRVERALKVVTFSGATVQFFSAFLSWKIPGLSLPLILQYLGLLLAVVGTAFFISAMLTMKNNWRSGYEVNQKTSLVVEGPYKVSRNPAFVGFDLLYIGCALVFPNVVNLLFSISAIVIFHLQVLEEERFCQAAFGSDYQKYQLQVNRYFGRKARH